MSVTMSRMSGTGRRRGVARSRSSQAASRARCSTVATRAVRPVLDVGAADVLVGVVADAAAAAHEQHPDRGDRGDRHGVVAGDAEEESGDDPTADVLDPGENDVLQEGVTPPRGRRGSTRSRGQAARPAISGARGGCSPDVVAVVVELGAQVEAEVEPAGITLTASGNTPGGRPWRCCRAPSGSAARSRGRPRWRRRGRRGAARTGVRRVAGLAACSANRGARRST